MIRVGVVEDHPLFRAALTDMLQKQGFAVVFVAGTIVDAREALGHHRVDVVLLDLGLPDGSGLELIDVVRTDVADEFAPRFVVLSSFDDAKTVSSVERSGCDGFLSKVAEPAAIAACVRAVAHGKRVFEWCPREHAAAPEGPVLTEREAECLTLAAEGMTNVGIAAVLGVSSETVKTHMAAVRLKLGASDRAQSVAIAVRRGIL